MDTEPLASPEARLPFWGVPAFGLAAATQGIIPFTHSVQFGPAFGVSTRPSSMPLWRDLVNAAGIGLLVCSLAFGALAVCYVSLCRAYGDDPVRSRREAVGALLRCGWLYPFLGYLGIPAMLVAFGAPSGLSEGLLATLLLTATLVPLFVFLSLAKRGAERAGVSATWAWLLVLVPLILAFAVDALVLGFPPGNGLIEPWLPGLVGDGS